MLRWRFSTGAQLAAEQKLVAKLRAGSKFYRFLFEIRGELFDDEFQAVLANAFAPRGQEPVPPGFLAMVNLLQRYTGLGDRDAVETAENDRRWQAVLGTLGSDEPGFEAYRARTVVEHKLARIDAVQGDHARYKGVRKNELDLNRAAAVINLQEIARLRRVA